MGIEVAGSDATFLYALAIAFEVLVTGPVAFGSRWSGAAELIDLDPSCASSQI